MGAPCEFSEGSNPGPPSPTKDPMSLSARMAVASMAFGNMESNTDMECLGSCVFFGWNVYTPEN